MIDPAQAALDTLRDMGRYDEYLRELWILCHPVTVAYLARQTSADDAIMRAGALLGCGEFYKREGWV